MPKNLKEIAARCRGRPDFLPIAQRFTQDYLGWRAQLGVLNKLLSNIGREHVLEHLMYFHFSRASDERGATFERLAQLSAARDRLGSRAVRTALRLAHIARLVRAGRSPLDKRVQVYTPTDALLALTRDAYALAFRTLDRLLPGLESARRLEDDPAFLPLILDRMGRAYAGFEPRDGSVAHPIDDILRAEGGRPIMSLTVDCGWRGRDLPPAQDIARRYYVSASQTRAVLKMAQARGLIGVGARGRLEDAGPLTEVYLDTFALALAHFAHFGLELGEDSFPSARDAIKTGAQV